MVNTLERPEALASDTGPSDEAELPTNRLSSTNLQANQLISGRFYVPDGGEESPIDWVQKLTSANPVTEAFVDEEPDPQPAPSGMGHHVTGPARMIPARRSLLPAGVKRAIVTLLIVSCAGGVGTGIYALVDNGSFATLFAPQAVSPATAPAGDQSQLQPPVMQDPTAVPQSVVSASASQLRDQGIEQYKRGNFDEAIKLLESASNMGTDDARVYYHMGLSYLAVGGREHSLDDAELAFRTAASLEPTWAAAHSMLAESLVRRSYYAEAIAPALEATRLDPKSGEAWMTLSRAYKGAGQETEATRAYAEAARLAPSLPMQP
jgi:cytochrome c-type biogenesis protein CcmH/NrfG